MTETIKKERIEARVTAEKKRMLTTAAALSGRSLSDFIIESAEAKALQTLRDQRLVELTAEEQRRFAEALLTPTPPNESLRRALARYRKTCIAES